MKSAVKVKGFKGRLIGVKALAQKLGKNPSNVSRVLRGEKTSRAISQAAVGAVWVVTPGGRVVPFGNLKGENGTATVAPDFCKKLDGVKFGAGKVLK